VDDSVVGKIIALRYLVDGIEAEVCKLLHGGKACGLLKLCRRSRLTGISYQNVAGPASRQW
jgi:hypothetical protein